MDLSMQRDLNCIIGRDYPSPIVNHTHAVKSARAKIVFIQKQEGFRDNSEKVYQKLGSRKRPLKKIKRSNSNRSQLSFKI
jgi:deoxyribodipyrimidine photo-lyase